MTTPLAELFKHSLWANLAILDACSNLSDEQLDTSVKGTYGSIRDTLLHMVEAEEAYVARLLGQPRPPSREDKAFPGFDNLRTAATNSGQALIDIAEQNPPTHTLRYVASDGLTREVENTVLITQSINHATEHRAHINTAFTHLGVEPLELDGWAYGIAHNQYKEGS